MLKLAKTRREDVHMTITILVHLLDVRHHAHSIVATVVQPAHKRRYINRFLCAFGGSVHGGGLLLRKTKGHVHPHALLHRHLRGPEALVDAGIFDIGIRNPRERLFALGQQYFSTGIEVSEDLDGDSRIADKGRDPLNNLLLLLLLFVPSEFSAGRDQTLYVRILGPRKSGWSFGCRQTQEGSERAESRRDLRHQLGSWL